MSKSHDDKASGTSRRGTKDESDVGAALKSAYEETLDEAIPQDLLDLLGKLD